MRAKGLFKEGMKSSGWGVILGLLVLMMTSVAWAAPTVLSFQPSDGSGAPLSPTVTATFSEPMHRTTITPGSFAVSRYVGFKAVAAGYENTVALRKDGTVVQWGAQAQTSAAPAGLTDVIAIEVNGDLTYAVKGNGTLVSWGLTNYPIPSGLTGIVAVASGGNQTVALKNDGTVVAWGEGRPAVYDEWGGETPPVPAAEVVPAGLSGVRAIAVGGTHVVALKHDGTVVAWGGYNESGQTSVPAGLSGVIAVAAGGNFTVALKNDGTVVCWGENYSGQLKVPAGLTDVVAISAGTNHTVAVKRDGTVVAWGGNQFGESIVPAGLTGVVAVDAGNYHTLALKSDGTLVGWGNNRYGQASVPSALTGVVAIDARGARAVALQGNGTVADDLLRYSPTTAALNYWRWKPAPADLAGVVKLAAGSYHTAALKNDGTLLSWGDDTYGSVTLPAGLAGVAAIAAGSYHTVALKNDGTVVAWGEPNYGKCTVPAGLMDVVAVAAGGSHSVAVKKDGTVVAWGLASATAVPTGLSGVVAVAAGETHTLALKKDGTVAAWGSSSYVPTELSGVVAVAAGSTHSVALKNDGTVVAWGSNSSGESAVPAGLSGVVAVAAGAGFTAALKEDGTVVSWGTGLMRGACTVLVPSSPYEKQVAGAVTYDETTRTATFTPSALLEPGVTYIATMNTGARSSVGFSLVADASWNFLTSGSGDVKQNQTISVTQPAPALTPCDSMFTVSAVASSGLPVTITGSGSCSASNTTGTATIVVGSSGPCHLSYSHAGNELYHPAATVVSTTALQKQNQTITVTQPAPAQAPWDSSFTVKAVASSGAPVTIAASGGCSASNTTDIATILVGSSGPCYVSYSQAGNNLYHPAPTVGSTTGLEKRNQTITVTQAAPAQALWDSSFTVRAVASSGAPVTITAYGSCTASNTTDSATVVIGNGTLLPCYLSYRQEGSALYHPAPTVGSSTKLEHLAWAAPTVLSFQPSEGSTAPLSASIAATFSKAMNPTSITPASFTVSRHIGFKAVVAGYEKTVALRNDGTVVQWGAYEQTLAVPAGLAGVTAIEVNGDLTYAVKGNGTVVSWGPTNYPIPWGLTGVVAVASSAQQTVALKNDGTVVAWGEARAGTMDGCDGGEPAVMAAQLVPAGLSGVRAIAVGGSHVVALKHDGTVVAWGPDNWYGETSVPAGLSGVIAVAAGGYHTVALKNDGTVVCWGYNSHGQLNVPAGLTDVVAVSAGSSNTVAVKRDGTVVAWGGNWYGQNSVPAGLTGVVAVDAGPYHSVALKSDGTFAGWGKNEYGQASAPSGLTGVVAIDANGSRAVALKGDGTVVDNFLRYAPSKTDWTYSYWYPPPADLTGVVELAAGKDHTVALKDDGTLLSWGYNYGGPVPLPAGLTGVTAIDAGTYHTLALKSDGTVVAWGNTNYGKLNVPAGLRDVVAVAAGGSWSVALKKDGTVVTWGDSATATTVPAGLSGVVAIAAGDSHTLALKQDGTVAAWGYYTTVPTGLSGVVAIAAGSRRSVALKNDGTVVAWGAYGDAAAPAGLSGVVAVAAGTDFSAALKADGTVVSWGTGLTRGVGSFLAPNSLYEKPVAGAMTYDETARTATFTPSALLEPGVTYTARVNTGVRSSFGNPLEAEVSWKFLTSGGAVKTNQTITVTQPAPAMVPCDSSFIVTAVASSGLPVTIVASGSCSASNTTGSATIVIGNGSLGPCYLTYSQGGSALYNPAPTVGSTTGLEMKKQVITFDPLPDRTYGDYPFTVSATASSTLVVSFSSSTPNVCTVAGNVVTIVGVGTCTITASQGGDRYCCAADPVTRSFNVGAGGLHHFAVLLDVPEAKVAGEAFGITIEARNVLGEQVTSFSGTVSLTTDAGKITHAGPVTFVNGRSAAVVTVTGAGSGKTITATGEGKSGMSSPFTVNPAAAVAFTVSAPTRATVGSGFTVGVTAKDIYNNVATGYVGKVHFTSSDPSSGLPLDYQFAAVDAGAHDFNVVLNTGGDQTVTATDTLDPKVAGVSAPIAVTNDANHRLRVTVPAATIAGEPFEVTVTAVDLKGDQANNYLGTVKLTSTDRPGEVQTLSFTEADNGSKTYTATFYKAGNRWITAEDSQLSVIRGTSGSIRVFPAAANKVAFVQQPGTTMVGQTIAPAVTVQLLDRYENLVTDSTAAVTLAIGSNPYSGELRGAATRDAIGGMATFADLSINKVGKGYTLDASSGSLTGATSRLFDVVAGVFHHFTISTIGPQTVTYPFEITITAEDSLGNTVTDFTGTARLTVSSGSWISGPTSTGAFDAGVWRGPVTLNGGGSGRTITATRTDGNETGTSNSFTLSKLNQNITVTKPAPATAEHLSIFEVSATAPSGQVAITTSGVCSGGGNGTAQIRMTAGAGTCTVLYNEAGSGNYNAAPQLTSSTGATEITKRDQAITVALPAPPSAPCDGVFTVTATASSGLGVSITTTGACTGSGTGSAVITVPRGTGTCTILYDQPGDAYFNPAFQMSSTTTAHPVEQAMTFEPLPDRTIGDAPFQVSATATMDMPILFTSLTEAVCTVSGNTVTLVGVGTCTIRAVQMGDCCVASPMERSFAVRPAPAVVFTVTAPTTAVAGVPFDVQVTAKDSFGNVATGYAGTAHLTSTDPNIFITLPADFQFTPELDQGVHLFRGVVLMTAGNQTITATDTVAPSISGTSGSIRINPASGRAMKVTAPATATAGVPIDVVVTVEDIYQNVVTDYTGTVHLASSDSQGLLPAEYTFVAADQGSKALPVTLKSAGDQTVTAADAEIAGTSGSIRVGHAVAGGLRFEQQPTTVTAGEMIMPAPTVKVIDQYGNFVADSTAPVTIALGNNPSSGTLSGTRAVNAVSGIATFAHLGIDMVGSGYTLTASSGELSATSIAFDVIPGASPYLFSGFLPPVNLGKPFKLGSTIPVKFQLTDAGGAIVTSAKACLEVVRTSNEVMIGDPIEIPANKDEGNCFRVSEGVYIYNLDTTGLEIGTYHIHAVIDDTTTHMIGMALK